MSASSRAREAQRRQLAYDARYRRGFPDWESFRAWQTDQLARLCGPWLPFEQRPARALMPGGPTWLPERWAVTPSILDPYPDPIMTATDQIKQDADTIVARMRERNPQIDHHTGREVSLEEFAFAILVQHRALTAGDVSLGETASVGGSQ